jgi:hypothetical protein
MSEKFIKSFLLNCYGDLDAGGGAGGSQAPASARVALDPSLRWGDKLRIVSGGACPRLLRDRRQIRFTTTMPTLAANDGNTRNPQRLNWFQPPDGRPQTG